MSKESVLAEKFFEVSNIIHNHLDNLITSNGTSPLKNNILSMLSIDTPSRYMEIAQKLNLAPRTISDLIDEMEYEELVERKSDLKDRRLKLIYLTEKGRETVISSQKIKDEIIQKFFGIFNLAQNEQFTSLLDRLDNNIKKTN